MNQSPRVPFVNLGLQYKAHRDEIIGEIDRISLSGKYVSSDDVSRFECNFAQYCDCEWAVAVGNGGDALYLSLLSLGVSNGDEIIIPVNSFVASAWAVAGCGARIVFVDVREDFNIDPELVLRNINSKTKGVMPVHLTGRPAPMNEIMKIAKDNNLFVIEDSAQAVGAKYYEKKVGSFGIVGCFSLHPLKNLHVLGDGGVITSNDKEIINKIRLWRNHGLKNRDECLLWGRNSRLDSIQAAIANIKLKYLDSWNERFRNIAHYYTEKLSDYVIVPQENAHEYSIFHRFIIQTGHRNDLQGFLQNRGVETKVNYPIPLHLQYAAQPLGYKRGDFPVAERQANEILSLPVYAEMTDAQVEIVIDETKNFFRTKV